LTIPPLVRYVLRLRHKGLRLGSYSQYQLELSDKVIHLRDVEKLTYLDISNVLILEGYRSPRVFNLGPESVFSIYKNRKIIAQRLQSCSEPEILWVTVEEVF
jgi:hypothetical protein